MSNEPIMLERIARAIAETYAEGRQAHLVESGSTTLVMTHWTEWIAEARAVLEAMREPTAGMLPRIGNLPARDAWRLMVEKALEETP
jgi:flagellar biosynthesis/type III secretory pathway protein FliH